MEKLTQFLKEVRHELSKVIWPTKNQVIQYTIVVVAISLAVAIFLGLLDFIFEWLLNKFVIR
ncbi:MAG: preprotein translocase subunit SecE [Candidatus Yanofskybacteria bacterium RIFCSPHIGHO2_02_FULL_43_22]|uniref:Protein translocase subunit SecE n=1 Tax=Candidatus Yanofskybacteria bacterium RIFCSPHIGHO2_02_FULL_43_22 TaxID=1802681 RepID=A0A1F8FMU8_9BACT|nr:MAG: preprotein translocase subunit SecE [Candidatus Yanofskybacteria bacterium RIFCSPHIGHO2_02_FULL_43_22]